jgi:preprotein translocase subunit SecG
MTILFVILVILASVLLGLIVLIQNPKGGGLAGNIAGFSNQFMGVKQTTDVLEKGTWMLAAVVGALCLFSIFFMGGSKGDDSLIKGINPGTNTTIPSQQSVPPATTNPQPAQPQPATPQK